VVVLERAAVLGCSGPAVVAGSSAATFADSTFVGLPLSTPDSLGGVAALERSRMNFARVSFRGLRQAGIVAALGAEVSAEDVVIVDTIPEEARDIGHGIEITSGATADIERAFVTRSHVIGVLTDGLGTRVGLRDLVVTETRAARVGIFGRALQVQGGSEVLVERAEFSDNLEVSMVSASSRTSLVVDHLRIARTRERECAGLRPDCDPVGIGVGVYENGAASLTRFYLGENLLAGAQLATGGQLDLADGEVAGNPVGVNVQVPDYDVGRLSTNVAYRDNGVNLDSAELPIPSPSAGGP
jgi:hypothetical protein